MVADAYVLTLPDARATSVLFSSPHSGCDYPSEFLARSILDERAIRSSEDAFVDRLFASAPAQGAPLLAARAPRAYLDLNRSSDELDPALIEGVRSVAHNPRVSSGLGVIPRVVANGRTIYRGKIGLDEARARIRDHWVPYHGRLAALIEESIATFGEAILIDCHSMPHEAIESISHPKGFRPDVVLGDRFGASARGDVMDRVEQAFTAAGLRVIRNAPFAGAYTTQHYGRPSRRQHVVQVEIDRALYMDERAIRPHAGFEAFRAVLDGVIAELADMGRPRRTLPLAAE
jgi:N-formylglutamate amidohydrolase